MKIVELIQWLLVLSLVLLTITALLGGSLPVVFLCAVTTVVVGIILPFS